MKLRLQDLKNAPLLPSSAVFSQGGKPYIYLVKGGVAHLVPVEVPFDDGVLAKVSVLERGGKGHGLRGRDLRKDELVVLSNQGELSDRHPVTVNLVGWDVDRENNKVKVTRETGKAQ
jgi:hypothetical protein